MDTWEIIEDPNECIADDHEAGEASKASEGSADHGTCEDEHIAEMILRSPSVVYVKKVPVTVFKQTRWCMFLKLLSVTGVYAQVPLVVHGVILALMLTQVCYGT